MVLHIPIAHKEGRYFNDEGSLERLTRRRMIVFRYTDEKGEAVPEANPNGSVRNIAGICNDKGNVVGLMPHPERAADDELGNTDGRLILESIIKTFEEKRVSAFN